MLSLGQVPPSSSEKVPETFLFWPGSFDCLPQKQQFLINPTLESELGGLKIAQRLAEVQPPEWEDHLETRWVKKSPVMGETERRFQLQSTL
jgi:hypothetical protein